MKAALTEKGEKILTVCLQNFCTIDEIAEKVGGFDFILADLGVSSMQIDNPTPPDFHALSARPSSILP